MASKPTRRFSAAVLDNLKQEMRQVVGWLEIAANRQPDAVRRHLAYATMMGSYLAAAKTPKELVEHHWLFYAGLERPDIDHVVDQAATEGLRQLVLLEALRSAINEWLAELTPIEKQPILNSARRLLARPDQCRGEMSELVMLMCKIGNLLEEEAGHYRKTDGGSRLCATLSRLAEPAIKKPRKG